MLQTLTALAEPNRLAIVDLLRAGAQPVGAIGARLRLNQPQVSKHLKVLRDAGLVAVQPRAQQRVYALQAAPLRVLDDWLAPFRAQWDERLSNLERYLVEMQEAEVEQASMPIVAPRAARTRATRRTTQSTDNDATPETEP
jgi:DNA-binding transcriptional ArsR family regulator